MSSNYYGQPDPYRQPAQPQPDSAPPRIDYADPNEATRLAQPAPSYANPPHPAQLLANPYPRPSVQAGSGYAGVGGQQPYLVQIGQIVVTPTEVHTPAGVVPLSQARFTFADQSYTVRKTPTWAVVTAIVGFFILTFFSLFFLLAKENQTTGQVVVGVYGPNGFNYAEPIYVIHFNQVQDAAARINYANHLASQA